MKEISLIEDIIQIAKYFQWDSEIGKEKAYLIMDEIHKGKYGAFEGIWPQTEKAIDKIKKNLTNEYE